MSDDNECVLTVGKLIEAAKLLEKSAEDSQEDSHIEFLEHARCTRIKIACMNGKISLAEAKIKIMNGEDI